jgi:hypothetical protein
MEIVLSFFNIQSVVKDRLMQILKKMLPPEHGNYA